MTKSPYKILLFHIFTLYLHRLRATIELWCNGNTADFGSVILSSNLGSSTILWGCPITDGPILVIFR